MEKAAYLEGQLTILKALESLILRYRDAASDAGNTLSADSLTHLLSDAPHTLQDALQMQRIIHFYPCGAPAITIIRWDALINT